MILLVAAVAAFVAVPLRGKAPSATEDPRRAELEARKEAKYRQIRDAELDRAQGKLSEEDWRRADRELRRDALEILRELERLEG